jgi:hypothetical protein
MPARLTIGGVVWPEIEAVSGWVIRSSALTGQSCCYFALGQSTLLPDPMISRLAGMFAALTCVPTGAATAQGLLPPVSPACISSPFGPRILPGKPLAGTYHYGIDLPAPAGTPVRAVAAGTVLTIHRRGAGGLEIALQHTNFVTLYAHLGSVTPALAQGRLQVAAGEALGVVGRTGVSYGTHVYFELRVNNERVDPAPYLHLDSCSASDVPILPAGQAYRPKPPAPRPVPPP